MWKTIVVITILLAALVGADVALSASEGNERASVKKVGRLVPKEERDRGQPAALVVDSAGKKTIYASTPNGWRCLTYRNAVAAQDAVQSVINKTFEAEGIVQSRDSALSHQYGLDVPSSMRLEVHGPKWEKDAKQDLIVAVDLGNPHIEKDGSFMRRAGETAIWSVDSNPHLELDVPAGSPLPAMLDPSIVPTYWLQQAKQVRTIRIERAGAPVLEMEIRDKQISPEEMR